MPGWCIDKDEFCPVYCDYETELHCAQV